MAANIIYKPESDFKISQCGVHYVISYLDSEYQRTLLSCGEEFYYIQFGHALDWFNVTHVGTYA